MHRPATRTARTCGYCGAPIRGGLYFCGVCAAPHMRAPTLRGSTYLARQRSVRRWQGRTTRLFWTWFLVLLGVGLTGHFLFAGRLHLQIVLTDLALLVLTGVCIGLYAPTLAAGFRRSGFGHQEAWIGLFALVPLLALNFAYHAGLQGLGAKGSGLFAGLEAELGYGTLVLLICALPALTEEIAFRGLMLPWLERAQGKRRALVLSAALFAGLHLSVLSLPYLFVTGLLFGWVTQRTGSLYPAMLLHFLHNLAVITLFTA